MESLIILLGVGFVFGGGAKLTDPSQAADLFLSWGLSGGWIVPVVGWVEVVLGLSLLNRPTRPFGAAGLALWMMGWGVIQLLAGSLAALASLAVLLVVGTYLYRRDGSLVPDGQWLASPLTSRPTRPLEAVHRLLRLVGLAFLIRWAVGGELFWIALPFLALWGTGKMTGGQERVESVLLHLLVLGLGVNGLWAFVGHTVLAKTVSDAVGWSPSPFQSELAFYHLGIAGLSCWWFRDHFWLAAAVIPSIFLYGAGWVHLSDYLASGNVADANWGVTVLFGNLVLLPRCSCW